MSTEAGHTPLTPVILWGAAALVAALLPMMYLASGVAFQLVPALTAWPWLQTLVAVVAATTATLLAWSWRARFDPRLRRAVVAATAMGVLSTGIHVTYVTTLSHQLPAAESVGLDVGDFAPDFATEGPDGRRFQLSEHRGQRVALVFYRGTW